jgi:hypothetical protein
MQTAGARVLQEDDSQALSREAVLLQWERKIEEAERRPSRFERSDEDESPPAGAPDASLREDPTHAAPRRFERRTEAGNVALAGDRRTITGRPAPPRRRRSVVENQLAQPDRIALWAFLLGLFLVAIAAGTAHA